MQTLIQEIIIKVTDFSLFERFYVQIDHPTMRPNVFKN